MGKVESGLELPPDLLMMSELSAVVRRDGLDWEPTQLSGDGLRHQLGRVAPNMSQAGEFRPALDEADNRRLMLAPDDGVSFPITES